MYDPMRYPIYIPPPPDKKNLAENLAWAIRHRDTGHARRLFDTAFWNKIDFVPDWHHLLCAVALKDQPMVRLLATHGAQWTEEEARSLKEIFPDAWPEFQALLRGSGSNVDFDLSRPADIYTRLALARRICKTDGDILPVAGIQEGADKMLSAAIVTSLRGGDDQGAAKLLRLRQPLDAVDIRQEIEILASGRDCSAALRTLSYVRRSGVRLVPVKINSGLIAINPDIVSGLEEAGVLDKSQPARFDIVDPWCRAFGKEYQSYKNAAKILFNSRSPVSNEEAEAFTRLYIEAKLDGRNIDRICDELLSIGFFGSPAWTPERLDALNTAVAEQSPLKQVFNGRAAAGRFRGLDGKALLKPEPFIGFVHAHLKGHYRAGERQMDSLLAEIMRRYNDGQLPEVVRISLPALKEGGADFHSVFWARGYLGRKEPGLAKILLELGILKAGDFNLGLLRQKAKLPEFAITFDPQKKTGKYVEFFSQVYLEKNFPDEFIKRRGKVASYATELVKKNPPPPPKKSAWHLPWNH